MTYVYYSLFIHSIKQVFSKFKGKPLLFHFFNAYLYVIHTLYRLRFMISMHIWSCVRWHFLYTVIKRFRICLRNLLFLISFPCMRIITCEHIILTRRVYTNQRMTSILHTFNIRELVMVILQLKNKRRHVINNIRSYAA